MAEKTFIPDKDEDLTDAERKRRALEKAAEILMNKTKKDLESSSKKIDEDTEAPQYDRATGLLIPKKKKKE